MSEKTEKPKIVPNPEHIEAEEEVPEKGKFPTKLVRNVIVGAVGIAITGYVVSKLRNKSDEDSESSESPWVDVFVPTVVPTQTASNE